MVPASQYQTSSAIPPRSFNWAGAGQSMNRSGAYPGYSAAGGGSNVDLGGYGQYNAAPRASYGVVNGSPMYPGASGTKLQGRYEDYDPAAEGGYSYQAGGGAVGYDPSNPYQYGGDPYAQQQQQQVQYPYADYNAYPAQYGAEGEYYPGYQQDQYNTGGVGGVGYGAPVDEYGNPMVQYDQYGQPIQYDEQGNPYDYYGQPIQYDYYGQYVAPRGPGTQQQAYWYPGGEEGQAQDAGYQAYDPYNVQGYRQAATVPEAYEPQPVAAARATQPPAEDGKTELHLEAVLPREKKREERRKKKKHRSRDVEYRSESEAQDTRKKKKKKKKKEIVVSDGQGQYVVSEVPSYSVKDQQKTLCVTMPAQVEAQAAGEEACDYGKEVIVYPSQYPEWMASVVAASALDNKTRAVMPTAVVHSGVSPPRSQSATVLAQPVTVQSERPEDEYVVHSVVDDPPPPPAPTVVYASPESLKSAPATQESRRRRYEVIPVMHHPPMLHIPPSNTGKRVDREGSGGSTHVVVPSRLPSGYRMAVGGIQAVPSPDDRAGRAYRPERAPGTIERRTVQVASCLEPPLEKKTKAAAVTVMRPRVVEITDNAQQSEVGRTTAPRPTTVRFMNPYTQRPMSSVQIVPVSKGPAAAERRYNVVVGGKRSGSFVQKVQQPYTTNHQSRPVVLQMAPSEGQQPTRVIQVAPGTSGSQQVQRVVALRSPSVSQIRVEHPRSPATCFRRRYSNRHRFLSQHRTASMTRGGCNPDVDEKYSDVSVVQSKVQPLFQATALGHVGCVRKVATRRPDAPSQASIPQASTTHTADKTNSQTQIFSSFSSPFPELPNYDNHENHLQFPMSNETIRRNESLTQQQGPTDNSRVATNIEDLQWMPDGFDADVPALKSTEAEGKPSYLVTPLETDSTDEEDFECLYTTDGADTAPSTRSLSSTVVGSTGIPVAEQSTLCVQEISVPRHPALFQPQAVHAAAPSGDTSENSYPSVKNTDKLHSFSNASTPHHAPVATTEDQPAVVSRQNLLSSPAYTPPYSVMAQTTSPDPMDRYDNVQPVYSTVTAAPTGAHVATSRTMMPVPNVMGAPNMPTIPQSVYGNWVIQEQPTVPPAAIVCQQGLTAFPPPRHPSVVVSRPPPAVGRLPHVVVRQDQRQCFPLVYSGAAPVVMTQPTFTRRHDQYTVVADPKIRVRKANPAAERDAREAFADHVADENLKLQRDIVALRRKLERSYSEEDAAQALPVSEQNDALRKQLRQLGKAAYDFSATAPDTDGSAKLIQEFAYQFNIALDDLNRTQRKLREAGGCPEKQSSAVTSGIPNMSPSDVQALQTLLQRVALSGQKAGIGAGTQGPVGEGTPFPPWFRSPLQADDIRHEMALIDDLIGQCQRIVAEAADQLWLVESAVRGIIDKVFDSLGVSGKPDPAFQDPVQRQSFLQKLKATLETHMKEIFDSRKDIDRIQDQINNIKARAWDPKRNLPYCSCRPRRDLLEDDVAHLMERLHEAGDQACQLREKLLGTELQNLTLQLSGARFKAGLRPWHVRAQEDLSSELEGPLAQIVQENETLKEKVLTLASQLQHREIENGRGPLRFGEVASARGERSGTHLKAPSRPCSPRKSPRGRELGPLGLPRARHKPTRHVKDHTNGRGGSKHENIQKTTALRQQLLDELEKHERILLGLQKELTDEPRALESGELLGTKHRLVARMQQGAQEIRTLLQNIERGIEKEEELALAYSISLDLKGLVEEVATQGDTSKMTGRELDLVRKVQRQARNLLKTNVSLQELGKNLSSRRH